MREDKELVQGECTIRRRGGMNRGRVEVVDAVARSTERCCSHGCVLRYLEAASVAAAGESV